MCPTCSTLWGLLFPVVPMRRERDTIMKRSPYFPPHDFHPRGTAVLPPAVLLPSPASARAARSRAGQRRRWQGRVTAVVATPPMLSLGGVTDEAGVAVWDCL